MAVNSATISAQTGGARNDSTAATLDSPLTLRFVLTFDDGPHANTAHVLRQLARNPVQPDIKAIFFVQTRHPGGGGTPEGRSMLSIEQSEGHLLGLHTGTSRHVSHTGMSSVDLDRSLRDGKEDLYGITGRFPLLVRPPYWLYSPSTLNSYGRHRLHMLLSDLKAFDGVNWGNHLFRRWNFRSQLAGLRTRFMRDGLPVMNHTIPIVVTFHDTNAYTAGHVSEYLGLLIEEAGRLGLPLHHKPFFDSTQDLSEVGLRRAVQHPTLSHRPNVLLEAP